MATSFDTVMVTNPLLYFTPVLALGSGSNFLSGFPWRDGNNVYCFRVLTIFSACTLFQDRSEHERDSLSRRPANLANAPLPYRRLGEALVCLRNDLSPLFVDGRVARGEGGLLGSGLGEARGQNHWPFLPDQVHGYLCFFATWLAGS